MARINTCVTVDNRRQNELNRKRHARGGERRPPLVLFLSDFERLCPQQGNAHTAKEGETSEIFASEECVCKISEIRTRMNAAQNKTAIYRSSADLRFSLSGFPVSGAACSGCGVFFSSISVAPFCGWCAAHHTAAADRPAHSIPVRCGLCVYRRRCAPCGQGRQSVPFHIQPDNRPAAAAP